MITDKTETAAKQMANQLGFDWDDLDEDGFKDFNKEDFRRAALAIFAMQEKPKTVGEIFANKKLEPEMDEAYCLQIELDMLVDEILTSKDLNSLKEVTRMNFPGVEPEDNQGWIEWKLGLQAPEDETEVEVKYFNDERVYTGKAKTFYWGVMATKQPIAKYRIKPNTVNLVCECKDIKPGGIVKVNNIKDPHCAYCGDEIITVKPKKKLTLAEFIYKNESNVDAISNFELIDLISEYLEQK